MSNILPAILQGLPNLLFSIAHFIVAVVLIVKFHKGKFSGAVGSYHIVIVFFALVYGVFWAGMGLGPVTKEIGQIKAWESLEGQNATYIVEGSEVDVNYIDKENYLIVGTIPESNKVYLLERSTTKT